MLRENGKTLSGCSSGEKNITPRKGLLSAAPPRRPLSGPSIQLPTYVKEANSVTTVWDSKHTHLLETINPKCPYCRLSLEDSILNCLFSRCLLKLGVTMWLKEGMMKEVMGGAPASLFPSTWTKLYTRSSKIS